MQYEKNELKLLYVLSSLLIFITLFLFMLKTYADGVVDVVEIDVPVSCTVSSGGGSYTETLTPNATTTIQANEITTSCNDNNGYAIYAVGYSGDSYDINNTDLINSDNNNYNIKTDGSGTFGSSWKMKLTAVTDVNIENNYTDFYNVPVDYEKVAYYASLTSTSTFTPIYQINVSGTQPAGTYIGQVKYTLVHPNMNDNSNKPPEPLQAMDCPAGSICYAPNVPGIIGSMDSINSSTKIAASPKAGVQDNVTSNTEIRLIAPNYKLEGYGFAGWSTDFEVSNSSTIYGPNETIVAPDVSSNGMILYPVWIASDGDIQQWTGCSDLTIPTYDSSTGKINATLDSVTALRDTRDGNVYAVARLVDGKCWMMENLRLSAKASRGEANRAKAQGYGDATNSAQGNLGKFIGLADSEDFFENSTYWSITGPTDANSIYYANTQNGTATINIMQNYYAMHRMPRYNDNNTNMAEGATNSNGVALVDSFDSGNVSSNARWFGYGNSYTWAAAMANTGYYTYYYNVNGDESQNSDSAGTSICPKGWKLPLGVASTGIINGVLEDEASDVANRVGGFSYLDRKMGGTGQNQADDAGIAQSKKWRSFPNNIVYAGNWTTAVSINRSLRGYYFSSSASVNNSSSGRYSNYGFYLYDGELRPGTNSGYNRGGAASVRCVVE